MFYQRRNVAAMLLLQFMLHIMLLPVLNVLYCYFNTFRSMRALRSVAVFCNSLADMYVARIFSE
jgi:hypothetical protein